MVALALLLPPAADCLAVPAPVVAEYAPMGRFAGHWGVDFGVTPGSEVRAVLPGVVTFSGLVVANRSVTLRHGAAMRTSYSFLSTSAVDLGAVVAEGDLLGWSGLAHGRSAWHFSLRLGDDYSDPMRLFGCQVPSPALWLVSFTGRSSLYAVARAERDTRRNFRSTSRGASHGGRSGQEPS